MRISEKLRQILCLDDDQYQDLEHPLTREIFRDYDIRGIFGETLFPEHAYKIGRKRLSKFFECSYKRVN